MSTIFKDITSRDPHRIWSASCAIAKLREPDELEFLANRLTEIEASTRGIELGGALFPNVEHLKFALRKLRFWSSKSTNESSKNGTNSQNCLCRLYPYYLMFDPTKEAAAGNVRILEDSKAYTYTCQCTICDTVFRVEEGDYHYSWWKWNVVNG